MAKEVLSHDTQKTYRIYPDRTTGGYRDHRHSGGDPLPRLCAGPRAGTQDQLPQQHEAAWAWRADVRARLRSALTPRLGRRLRIYRPQRLAVLELGLRPRSLLALDDLAVREEWRALHLPQF